MGQPVFKVRVPPPAVDRVGVVASKFRSPKLEARTKYCAGQVIFFRVCMVLLNFFYNHLISVSRIIILPLMVYFMWSILKKEFGILVGDREGD
jgi:hypothetical protein